MSNCYRFLLKSKYFIFKVIEQIEKHDIWPYFSDRMSVWVYTVIELAYDWIRLRYWEKNIENCGTSDKRTFPWHEPYEIKTDCASVRP